MAAVLKTVGVNSPRRFESYRLRQFMREFDEEDYPPFLDKDSLNDQTTAGVETTLQELSEKQIRLSSGQKLSTLPPAFLQTYGSRRVFTVIDFSTLLVDETTGFFIEVFGDDDAEALRQSLTTVLAQRISCGDELLNWFAKPPPDFCWFQIQ